MAKVAVILSGCGYLDGAEVHEAVITLLCLSQEGHFYTCFAPDIPQAQVINHITKKPEGGSRNCLVESARIARTKIKPLSELSTDDFDALMLPGGFGVGVNLSTFATDKAQCSVNEELKKAVLAFHRDRKPIGACCISPAILAKIFEGIVEVELTLGSNPEGIGLLEEMSARGTTAKIDEIVVDEKNRVYTTPAYMEPEDLAGLYEGVSKTVARLTEGCRERALQ
jgi:enhancing lycopene biosynthesis protein 2